MRVEQAIWESSTGWNKDSDMVAPGRLTDARLVIFYTSTEILEKNEIPNQLRIIYPQADIVGCSGGGEIFGTRIYDNSLVMLAMAFDKPSSTIKIARTIVDHAEDSKKAGAFLINQLPKEHLKHVYLLTNAFKLDPYQLVEGASQLLPPPIGLTGGVAADYVIEKTYVYVNGEKQENSAVMIGFYGPDLNISYSCESGWKPYGPQRVVTKCKDERIIYELDNKPALSLYKNFLGPYANRLPAIALRYPFAIGQQIRTIFRVDEAEQSVILSAGGVPEGTKIQFMITNMDTVIAGAESAAQQTVANLEKKEAQVILLNSCAARRQVLTQRTEEEVEVVDAIFNGKGKALIGCYNYGEICPSVFGEKSYLQNQTMTILAIAEE